MTSSKNSWTFLKYEKYFFLIILLLHLLPLFAVKYFVTVDGPAHLYNANLIKNFLNGHAEFISRYFYFNPNLEPNWTGHFLMAVFLFFLPAFLAEKLLLILYVVLLPVSFRLLVTRINPDAKLLSYLIFPFIYNLSFCFGFYNFSLGLPVLFFGIFYWMRYDQFNLNRAVIFFLLVTAAYFSHLFSCLILLGIAGSHLVLEILMHSGTWKSRIRFYRSKVIVLAATVLPAMMMVLLFVQAKGITGYKGKISYLPFDELVSYFLVTRTIICWIYETEKNVAVYMSFVFLALLLWIMFSRIVDRKKNFFRVTDYWFLIALILLIAFFIMPDGAVSGGFISVRVLLYFHLFLITWFAVQEIKPDFGLIFSILALAISFRLMIIHMAISSGLDKDAKEYVEIISHIPENNNLLPLNYGDNWLHLNLSNYAGSEKNIIVMDNYEPNYPQFPLKWQKKSNPYENLGSFASSKRPCIYLDAYENESGLKINYIVRWGHNSEITDSCTLSTNSLLEKKFDLVFTSSGNRATLFKRKGYLN